MIIARHRSESAASRDAREAARSEARDSTKGTARAERGHNKAGGPRSSFTNHA
jgi:hypothetical protein